MGLLALKWEQLAISYYYHLYLQQYGKYLDVDLIGSKTTNQKEDEIFSLLLLHHSFILFSFIPLIHSLFLYDLSQGLNQSWIFCFPIWAIIVWQIEFKA